VTALPPPPHDNYRSSSVEQQLAVISAEMSHNATAKQPSTVLNNLAVLLLSVYCLCALTTTLQLHLISLLHQRRHHTER